MTAAELLSKLRGLDVKVWADNGKLCCNGPNGSLTAELHATLNERKEEILALLDQASAAARRREPPLQRVARDGDFPLSFAQQRLWFVDQFEPDSSLYNVARAFRIRGSLNRAALEQSLNEIVRRHEILRTTFSAADGRPAQKISPSLIVALPMVDLTGRPGCEREDQALRLINEEARRPFDLSRGPLLRPLLVRLATDDHILLLTLHHIVCDGWSIRILYRELSVLYHAFCSGRSSPLAELSIQYSDFAQWQRQLLQGEMLEDQIRYWKSQLENLTVLDLPTDRPRPLVQRHQGGKHTLVLSGTLSAALEALSRKEGASLFMTLLAAFKILLHRYTGQEHIAVGTPIAGQNRVEIEPLIGFFVNTLVLRSDLSGNPTFRQLLGRVREVSLEAYDHQDVPFEKLVEELQPERNLSSSPLFQVMFALQNFSGSPLEVSGCSVEPLDVDSGTAKFDLTLHINQEPAGMRCLWVYDTDLFKEETIARTLGHWQTLLDGIVANPEARVSGLPLMTEPERYQLLVEWNETKEDYPREKCLHQLFEEQVERTPDAVAVLFEDTQLTYQELNRRANQLAHHLQKLGVGPEVLAGICMERSLDMVVGILGILKAGGAYVPLDPDYPEERLAFVLDDSHPLVVLTQRTLLSQLPVMTADGRSLTDISFPAVICLDADWETIAQECVENPTSGVKTDNLAYVIYTSGSTGKPKGVMVEHRSLVNYLCWFNGSPLAERACNLPVTTKLTFDASLKQLFSPLLRGNPVWLVSDALVNQPMKLLEALRCREKFSLSCVPSLWNAVTEAIDSGPDHVPPETLSSLLLGGEDLNRQLLKRTFAIFPGLDVWNLYGPTEATANATFARVSLDGPITIGRPIGNTQVYILDRHLNPVPIGVAGEIHIAGEGLARGYLNQPELTEERFISNPFSDDPKARLYITGDFAHYLPDGNIEFLGRLDNQVKIRGFRIELGEIEAVLRQDDAVKETVVLAREDEPGGKRLIAFVVLNNEHSGKTDELRRFLRQKLPDYMIPGSFVVSDRLPLTPNGKLDRRALLAINPGRTAGNGSFVAPTTLIEKALAKIWAEVLKVEQVGIHDNFFDLGGHSLLATGVISRVRDVFCADVPLRLFFEGPMIAELALAIEETLIEELEALPEDNT